MAASINSTPHNLFSTPDPEHRAPKPDVFLHPYHSPVVANELIATARALVHPRGKGIYAADETPEAIEAAFHGAAGLDAKDIVLAQTEEETKRRRRWREFSIGAISNEHISGIILHSESLLTFHHAPLLTSKHIIPGIRANLELRPLPSSPSEFAVQGIDDLLPRLQASRAAGARFAKFRVPVACTSFHRADIRVPNVGGGLPSEAAVRTHAETLAQFAAISQEAGLVPILEPDVEFRGDAGLERSVEVHERVIRAAYARCVGMGVLLEGTLLKPSFPQPGLLHPSRANVKPEEIALATATVVARSVPTAVPGVLFLSGGLDPSTAAAYLGATNALTNASPPTSPFARLPALTFSFGRALQGDALKLWVQGDEAGAREAFGKWQKVCGDAVKGIW